jgi:hypothetical protein
MIPVGKCPKCEQTIHRALFDEIEIGGAPTGISPTYRGYTILCPNPLCRAVLGAGFDPLAIQADTVREVLRGLGVDPKKGRRR